MKLVLTDSTRDYIRHSHPELKRRIRAVLKAILEGTERGKPLAAELAGLLSYRIGRFRIVYRITNDECVEIITIGPRPGIYELTYRLLRRDRSTIHDR